MADTISVTQEQVTKTEHGFVRAIGLFDGTMIVVGSMTLVSPMFDTRPAAIPALVSGFLMRSKLNFTASALNGVPS